MRYAWMAVAWGLIGLPVPAMAGGIAEYSGPHAVQEGEGGTKVTKHGVDFWTTGAPYGRFRVLGVYVDSRTDGAFAGNAVGSKGIAKKVLKAGGDGVIVAGQDSRYGGTYTYATGGEANAQVFSNAYNNVTTRLIIIKQLKSNVQE